MRRFALTTALQLVVSICALAQSPSATLSGRVLYPTQAAVSGASVTAINIGTNVVSHTTTNNEGFYIIVNLPPGPYRVAVTKQGFKALIKPDVILHVQDVIAINFDVSLGAVSESVTVESGAPLIDTESAAVSTVVDRQFAENLPMNGRSFQSLIEQTPGVVLTANNGVDTGQFSINGQRANANYWTVDGASANIGINAGATAGSGLGADLNGHVPGMLGGGFYASPGNGLAAGGEPLMELAGKALDELTNLAEGQAESASQQTVQNQVTPQSLAAQVPPEAKAAIMNAVNASNWKTADDTKGGFHEEGGQWGTTTSGTVSVAPAVPGSANLAVVGGAHMDTANAVDPSIKNNWKSLDGNYHVHPSGSTTDANGQTKFFVQDPSSKDIKGVTRGINIVVGAGNKKVYFYNNSGTIGKPMKLKDFMGQ